MANISRKIETEETLALVRSLLTYDPNTGSLLWRATRRANAAAGSGRFVTKAGEPAGRIGQDGYGQVGIQGRRYQSHRLIWAIVYGRWPSGQVDHRDLDRANNGLTNLREATYSQQKANTPPRKHGKLKGVTALPSGGWQAQIKVNGKSRYLGSFRTEKDAHAAYARAAIAAFGEFARLA